MENERPIDIYLEKKKNSPESTCCRCGSKLHGSRGKHRLMLEHMPIFNFKVYLHLWREKGHCKTCNKARSEAFDFIADETPHLTKEYSWWFGKLCEMCAVKKAAELTGVDNMTLHRLDFARLKKLVQHYKIPDLKRISVDEVYGAVKNIMPKNLETSNFSQ